MPPLLKIAVLTSCPSILMRNSRSLHLSGGSRTASFPDFSDVETRGNLPMSSLKNRCQNAKPLGLIRCPKYDKDDKDEFLVIYDGTFSVGHCHHCSWSSQ